ncbi:ribonuclease Z [archaeon]|nr:ribonuclease Z [archaeon]
MKLTFLGTSSMIPTKDRNTTAILLNHKSENILIDCGEGTQRQLKKANISPTKITKILITHWHGDHILGLPGLLETLAKLNYNKTLEIYGPTGTKKFIKELYKIFISQFSKIKLKVEDITKNGKFFEDKILTISAQKLDHTTTCYGYAIQEKDRRRINLKYTKKFGLTKHPLLGKLQQGKTITYKGKKLTPQKATKLIKGEKITFIIDTKKPKNITKFAENSEILVSESTYSTKNKDLAKSRKHMTSKDAAEIAKAAKVKKLILTHFSQRYQNTKELEKEAKKVFKNTVTANDFSTF